MSSPRPVCPLTLAAWRLGGLTLSELWQCYFALGGHQPQTALGAYLDGAAAWPDLEHNVLAQALNESLWDVGVPSMAPHREPEASAREAAPDVRRPLP